MKSDDRIPSESSVVLRAVDRAYAGLVAASANWASCVFFSAYAGSVAPIVNWASSVFFFRAHAGLVAANANRASAVFFFALMLQMQIAPRLSFFFALMLDQ